MEPQPKKPRKRAIIISLIAILISTITIGATYWHHKTKQFKTEVAQCVTQLTAFNTKAAELKKLDPTANIEHSTQCETIPVEATALLKEAESKLDKQIETAKAEAKKKEELEAKKKAEAEAKAKAEAEAKKKAEEEAKAKAQQQAAEAANQTAPAQNQTWNNPGTNNWNGGNNNWNGGTTNTWQQPAPAPQPAPTPAPQPPANNGDGSRWVETETSESWVCTGTTDGQPFDCHVVP